MQPPDPSQGTSLDLPTSPPPRQPDPPHVEQPPGPLGDLVVAHFRRVEIAMLGRVLITTLGGALPASMVTLERRRSLGQRLSGRAGEPIGITITAGERLLSFRQSALGVTEALVGHTVRGVVLSTTPVPVAQWLDELGDVLEQVTRDDEAARTALERALLS
ncbi:MAG TPA: hypothetical protein VGN18_04720 [Jatrophihabitans sp.]|jgi:hypothetical protein|uniref:hypothetical protein n=1 Tax=Jatrophihabitans sp. TaxID=1932789 RepID=UPI002DF8DE84|nr:hypothetical protein [Jatrophihabitans sp.]